MKKIRKNHVSKVALLAGTAAFAAFVPMANAENSVDSLLEKQRKLQQEARLILTLSNAVGQMRARQSVNSQALLNSYIQRQNEQAVINGLQDIQTTIQNQGNSRGVVVVPR